MNKAKTAYACQNCGYVAYKWMGKCPDCGAWNSFVEEITGPSGLGPRAAASGDTTVPVAFQDIDSHQDRRFSSGILELDRVLGGGVVPGSLTLVGGDPGIGKSTLLLQAASLMQLAGGSILYVSGEESEQQIKMRGDRLGIRPNRLYLFAETCVERILESVNRILPSAVILDSIQTTYSEKLTTAPGSVSQVREVATQVLFLCKRRSIPAFLIGHITKDGSIAGPKSLEHIVDTVLYFEGERYHSHRIIRTVKNRFGAANEVGVFEMTNEGLVPVENPSKLFLSERPAGAAGSVVTCCLEGSRPILVELQALVSSSSYASARRMAAGVDPNRVSLMLAMLEKRLGFHLLGCDVYLNVAGGLTLNEPSADLGIVTAIVSSYRNHAVDAGTVIIGEVGLAGEVRGTSHTPLRVRESASLGFRKCVLPRSSLPKEDLRSGIDLIPVQTVQESLEILFR